MKQLALFVIPIMIFLACKKPAIPHTEQTPPAIQWPDTSTKHPMNTQFRDFLEKYRLKGLPGISLLVNDKNGTWVGSTGMADIKSKISYQPGHVSKIASITKLMVGTLVFKLIEDSVNSGLGYLSLNQPITKWIPAKITDRIPNGHLITLGQCMKHETGVPDIIEENKFYLAVLNNPNKKWEAEELLEFIYDKDPDFVPGDTAVYSNTNTTLLSMVIEYATGRKHADLLREKILTPLRMNDTYYQPHDALPPYLAQGYYDLYGNNTVVNVSNLITGSGNGFGGVFSNVLDMFTFIDHLLLKKDLISAQSLEVMTTFGKADPPNRYGYGIMMKFIERGIDAGLGHSGRDVGYSANLFYFPNKNVTHAFCVNYGTDGDSELKLIFGEFQEELLNLTLK